MATISETELRRKLKRLENSVGGGGSSQVTNIGDNTYEYTNEYTYIAYAATISNVNSGVIQNQSDATGFSFSAISESGTPLGWLGYFTSKSLVQSGDPSDYIWTDLSSDLPASSVIKYYTESTNLLTNIGNPYNLVAGVSWTLFSGSIPASAFWTASRYIINGIETSWYIVPVKTKQSDLGLITHTISGRNKPVMNDSVWRADAIAAISTFTGNAYSTTNEMGFGTVIGITYDNGSLVEKLFGMLKKETCSIEPETNTTQSLCEAVTSPFQGVWTAGGTGTWVTTPTFIDGQLLVTETIVADKIAANAITASKLSIVGTDDVRTITGSKAAEVANTLSAANAQEIADGEIVGFFQTTEPTTSESSYGDIWIDTTGAPAVALNSSDIKRYQNSSTPPGSSGNLGWYAASSNAIGLIYLDTYNNKATYNAYVSATITDLATIQSQIDGSITTFFYNVAPTLTNVPASGWDSTNSVTDKTLWYTTHLGDIYYDNVTGYAYRFVYQDIDDSPDAGIIYSWLRITDNDMVTALANASTAQDTADGKRRVFVVTPTPPYDVGDLWAEGNAGDIKKCVTLKATGAAYNVNDWSVASKYTDDTIADSKIKTYYQNDMPDFTGVNWTAFAILIAEYVTGSTSTAENGLLETTITYPVGGSSTRELADVKNSGSIDISDYIEVLRHVTGAADAAYAAYLDNFVKNHLVTTSAWATITAAVDGVQTLIVSNNVSSANPSMVRNSPTTMVLNVGDMWIDSFNKNQLYRFDGTNWVKSQDTTVADNIYVSNTTTIDGGTISAGTKITAGTSPNVGVLDGTDNSSGGDGPWRIYAGHATAASAPFRVAQDGTVTIEQATSTGKLVIEGDVIKVYTTSSGVDTLRVKLGNLS